MKDDAIIIANLKLCCTDECFYTFNVSVSTDGGELLEFKFRLSKNKFIPHDLYNLFKGSSVAQLKSFLNTIGEVYDDRITNSRFGVLNENFER